MISAMRRIPVTEKSHPFATAVNLSHLGEKGYAEDEYFFDGTANVYERTEDGGKRIRFADAPYTSRYLLRRPADPESFSGNVIFEIMNSTPGFDLDRNWILFGEEVIRRGDIYVGILSKPNVIRTLKRSDPERYESLTWPNPLTYDIPEEKLGNIPGSSSKDQEDGLFWNILMDTARLLRRDTDLNPIRDYLGRKPLKLILTGWSQSGGYMIRYMKDFAGAEGKDCFDGYFACGCASVCTPNLNQEDLTNVVTSDHHLPEPDRPYIDMHTECENAKIGGATSRGVNGRWYRIYDVAGPSHDTTESCEEYKGKDPDLIALGIQETGSWRKEKYANSFPYSYVFCAGLALIEDWVRDGKEPFTVDPIPYDENLENLKDDTGNSIGGWRIPQIALPVCEYRANSTPKGPEGQFSSQVYGCEIPYSREKLKEMYGSLDHYRQLLEKETDRCIAEGLLLPEDGERSMERAAAKAEEYGLL